MPQCAPDGSGKKRILLSMVAIFGMLHSTGCIASLGWKWLVDGPISFRRVMEEQVSVSVPDDGTRLHDLKLYSGARLVQGSFKGIWIAWPGLVSAEFALAVRCLGPMILVVVTHWAVLLHRMASSRMLGGDERLGETSSRSCGRSYSPRCWTGGRRPRGFHYKAGLPRRDAQYMHLHTCSPLVLLLRLAVAKALVMPDLGVHAGDPCASPS